MGSIFYDKSFFFSLSLVLHVHTIFRFRLYQIFRLHSRCSTPHKPCHLRPERDSTLASRPTATTWLPPTRPKCQRAGPQPRHITHRPKRPQRRRQRPVDAVGGAAPADDVAPFEFGVLACELDVQWRTCATSATGAAEEEQAEGGDLLCVEHVRFRVFVRCL